MRQNTIFWLVLSGAIMLLLPWIAVTFVKGDGGMTACFILFFAIDPIYSVVIGASAGKNSKRLWYLPVISAVLFLLGTWIFFDMGEIAFILYAMIYLVLGVLAMLISMVINKKSSIAQTGGDQ